MRAKLSVKVDAIAAAVVLALSCGILFYFIAVPAWTEFHGDCTDSLLWSQIMVETGSILAEDFAYAAILPFGSPLWMVPILWIFGYGKTAHVLSMCVFVLLFVGGTYLLMRALKWRRLGSALAAGATALLLTGSEKLREIMWGHVIYYSLALLFVLYLLNLVIRLWDGLDRWQAADKRGRIGIALQGAGLFLLTLGCATDGFQVIIISVVPMLIGMVGAVATDPIHCLRKQQTMWRGAMGVGMVAAIGAGLLVLSWLTKGGTITADYEQSHTGLSPMEEWGANLGRLLPHWLTLFGVQFDAAEPLGNINTLFALGRLVVALVILVCPFILLGRTVKSENAGLRLLSWTHLGMTGMILFAFICGKVSGANWRLTSWLGTSVICTVVLAGELLKQHNVPRRMGGLLSLAVGAAVVVNTITLFTLPCTENLHETMAKTLIEKGYTRGYASFWQALDTDFFGGDDLQVTCIEVSTEGIIRRDYQTRESWFDDVEGQENYFVILTGDEYAWVSESYHWKEINEQYEMVDLFDIGDNGEYSVFVFDGNVVKNFD